MQILDSLGFEYEFFTYKCYGITKMYFSTSKPTFACCVLRERQDPHGCIHHDALVSADQAIECKVTTDFIEARYHSRRHTILASISKIRPELVIVVGLR